MAADFFLLGHKGRHFETGLSGQGCGDSVKHQEEVNRIGCTGVDTEDE